MTNHAKFMEACKQIKQSLFRVEHLLMKAGAAHEKAAKEVQKQKAA